MPDRDPPPSPAHDLPDGLAPEQSAARTISSVRTQLDHLERLLRPEIRAARSVEHDARPTWMRVTDGELRWPVAVVIVGAIALQYALPSRLSLKPSWLLPSMEAALSLGLFAANPRRIDRSSNVLRGVSLTLIGLTSVGNGWSAVHLIAGLINGTETEKAGPLLANGASIYLTNVIVFALWYWEFDRGGPVQRATTPRPYGDFLFPQMATPEAAAPGWKPNFIDYLYVSFTNATAFSPTDTMPLSRWAKILMLLQSAVALATVGLVVARAVNILG